MMKARFLVLVSLIGILLGLGFSDDEAGRLLNVIGDPARSASERNTALNALRRLAPATAMDAAAPLLESPHPNLRLSAAWIRARGGDAAGEGTLLAMLRDSELSLGFRGIAAQRLGRLRSGVAHATVIELARRESAQAEPEKRVGRREGLQWGLLEALGDYGRSEDFEFAAQLYKATALRAPARSLGLFGHTGAIPLLRKALARERNAGAVIEIQLALARSGGEDGRVFVQRLLHGASQVRVLEGQIDLQKEDPSSGRLAETLLLDLGSHASDRQFMENLIALMQQSPCRFCEAAWSSVARIGIRGYEDRLVELAATMGVGASRKALQVLAYHGADVQVRTLAKRMGLERDGEALIAAHDRQGDRRWFVSSNAEPD